ncbi:FKBP-type peptidyl-prolyl cis-trans isomerase [Henriciella litoralis]|uniref:FKBP-type peptidyl-prolyl cis-trans isomerase n=1 Tax=Henriciella litoralis TaxID=568102 RepID=UPI0009FECD30|nr:FKBP-type peptidyl-prolyl cis-trans isomerase [Henriciella litoralis]
MAQSISSLKRFSTAFASMTVSALILSACQTTQQPPAYETSADEAAVAAINVDEKQAAKRGSACPEFARGPGKLAPLFPATCASMQETDSGLRWIELAQGPADREPPLDGATVIVAYEGYLADTGARFDSSYERGEASVFVIDQVIRGWTETLKMMTPGDEWLVYIPADLAYGATSPSASIPANSDLVFKIRLDGFLNAEEVAELPPIGGVSPKVWESFLPWDTSREGVRTEDSGLSYAILESGDTSGAKVFADDFIALDYEARLADTGELISTTWTRDAPLVVRAGDLIPGFAQMVSMMRPGDIWIGHLPAAIAYGKTGLSGVVPPNSDLAYVVNLIAINPPVTTE